MHVHADRRILPLTIHMHENRRMPPLTVMHVHDDRHILPLTMQMHNGRRIDEKKHQKLKEIYCQIGSAWYSTALYMSGELNCSFIFCMHESYAILRSASACDAKSCTRAVCASRHTRFHVMRAHAMRARAMCVCDLDMFAWVICAHKARQVEAAMCVHIARQAEVVMCAHIVHTYASAAMCVHKVRMQASVLRIGSLFDGEPVSNQAFSMRPPRRGFDE